MPLPFSLFLALKYLRPKRTFVSVVSIFSVLGVLIGVMVLVVVISVMTGFDRMWERKILGFSSHILVSDPYGMQDPNGLMEAIESTEGVLASSPVVGGPVLILHRDHVFTPMLKGINPELEKRVSDLATNMWQGVFSLSDEEMLLGSDLATEMGIHVGDEILIYSVKHFTAADERRLPEELIVAGIFRTGMYDFDSKFIVTSLGVARDLYGLEESASGIQVKVADPLRANITAEALKQKLGPRFYVRTWTEEYRTLFVALQVEKNMMYFLLIFILVVAAFGITNTLITSTIQKTGEIGLLKAVGFSGGQVMRVFFWQGLVVGVIGTILGIGSGLVVLHYRNDLLLFMSSSLNFNLLPPSLYRLAEIPSHTSGADLLMIGGLSMLICTLAGLIPASRAARLDPIKALKHE